MLEEAKSTSSWYCGQAVGTLCVLNVDCMGCSCKQVYMMMIVNTNIRTERHYFADHVEVHMLYRSPNWQHATV